ncbi:MFS transporter [Natronospirillum operosum]|uniref:3-methyl-2-oxobutanoate dehydrogenase (2-methylpropanoyl-transferring) n=1 Tax=Natronospirillum operosum TaxID=2759953 RepID=A0A4Z0WDJ5_9GAMM|nr:thiamine pyrophosphate-dependent enzyme [Natronospirillum operosum]TGG92809.1 MFS transporter [Natronospirillum operosum]
MPSSTSPFAGLRHLLLEAPLPDLSDTRWRLADTDLGVSALAELFESQLLSRVLDLQARVLQPRGDAYYTIGSAGHEANAALGLAFRAGDPAFLHYRDAALFIQRSKAVPGQTITWDMLLSFMASTDDPIAGGRHKVLGSRPLNVPPQTSTIASHLPKAVGAAYSLGLWRRLGGQGEWSNDSVVLCSFGDASLNHSTAQGALNTAGWTAFQGVPLPLVFVCADNGIGISTPTPPGWVEASVSQRPGLHYIHANGLDLVDTWQAGCAAARHARRRQKPVFLHLDTVRLLGHAGSDTPESYLTPDQITAMEARDPLRYSAARLVHEGGFSRADLAQLLEQTLHRVDAVSEQTRQRPRLQDPQQVMSSIVPPKRASRADPDAHLPAGSQSPQPMAKLINQALHRLLRLYPQLVMAGEDIGRKGGVYGVTLRLQQTFGRHRVIDTLLDEQSILGLAIGLGQNGMLPIAEIQFLAYLHNAEDQLRGEAATLSFFSSGQYTNPMIVRIAGLGYQKGFGGHFHNDNALAVLRDIPGLVVACPSDGAEAVGMLQECVRLADEEQRVVVFLEPIARYHCRDLHEDGDQGWCRVDPGPDYRIPHRQFRCDEAPENSGGQAGKATRLAIITYGNGVYLSEQARPLLAEQGLAPRLIDLRWLTDIDHDALHETVHDCTHVLIVDECRRHGSVSEELMAELTERGFPGDRLARLTADDSFIALGRAATSTLPGRDDIVAAALSLAAQHDREATQ